METWETRKCNVCGEEWVDTGDFECPFCGSSDTFIDDEEEWADEADRLLDAADD